MRVTGEDEVSIPVSSPCGFMDKVDNICSGIGYLRGIIPLRPDIINTDQHEVLPVKVNVHVIIPEDGYTVLFQNRNDSLCMAGTGKSLYRNGIMIV